MGKFRRFFRDLKIRQKIQLFATLSVLLVSMIFLFFYGQVASRSVMSRSRDRTAETLQHIGLYFQDVNEVVTARLNHLGSSISVQKRLEAGREQTDWSAAAVLRDIQAVSQIEVLELYTLDGAFVEGSREDEEAPAHLSQAVLDTLAAAPRSSYWCDEEEAVRARSSGISVYQIIYQDAERPIGIARARLSASALSDVYNYVGFNVSSNICLFSDRGNLLLPWEAGPAILRVGRDCFEDYRAGVEQEEYSFRNQRYLVQSLPLEGYGLYAVSVASYAQLNQDVHLLQITILLLGLVCIVGLLAFFALMGNSLSKPIVELSGKMEQVREGDLTLRSNSQAGDEIGDLSRNFDRMLDRIEALVQEVATVEKRRHELELIALQTQITPHFLYNSLDSVSALVQMGDMDGAFQMSQALGGFYRGVLSDGRSVVSIEEELRMTDSYLQVQSQRYRDKLSYEIDVPAEIRSVSIVKLTIQPLVENAIYHGLRMVRRPGRIVISGRIEGEEVILSVWDNGKGMAQSQETAEEPRKPGDIILHRKGYGMYNADQRIKLCFGREYGLRVESVAEEWTRVDVHLPLRPKEELRE